MDQERSLDNEIEESVQDEGEEEGIKPHKVIDMKDAEEGENQDIYEDKENDDKTKEEEGFYGKVYEDAMRNENEEFHDETDKASENEERDDEENKSEDQMEYEMKEQKEDESDAKENKEISVRIEEDENDENEFADDDNDEIIKETSKYFFSFTLSFLNIYFYKTLKKSV